MIINSPEKYLGKDQSLQAQFPATAKQICSQIIDQ